MEEVLGVVVPHVMLYVRIAQTTLQIAVLAVLVVHNVPHTVPIKRAIQAVEAAQVPHVVLYVRIAQTTLQIAVLAVLAVHNVLVNAQKDVLMIALVSVGINVQIVVEQPAMVVATMDATDDAEQNAFLVLVSVLVGV